jgi:hypothetical protein
MKRLFIPVFLIFGMININEIIAFSSGITGYYNSTLGSSCLTCHGGTSGGSTQLNFSIPPSGIVPNGIYPGTIRAQKNGAQIFGFSLVAQNAPMSNYGELIPFDSLKTQNIVGNLTHQKDGGLQNDSVEFKFYWKAPSRITSQTLNFKWNVLCGDNDGTITGDVVANGNQTFQLAPNAASEINSVNFEIFPNPTTDYLTFKRNNPATAENLQIFNLEGKLVYQILLSAGTDTLQINTSNWTKGFYLLNYNNFSQKLEVK